MSSKLTAKPFQALRGSIFFFPFQFDFVFRSNRKIIPGAFMQKSSASYRPIQSLESKQLMRELVDTPKNYRVHLERYATSVVVSVTYGRRVHDIYADEVVRYNRQSQDFLTSIKSVSTWSSQASHKVDPLCPLQHSGKVPRRIPTNSAPSSELPYSLAN
jgi:hypothetical protein